MCGAYGAREGYPARSPTHGTSLEPGSWNKKAVDQAITDYSRVNIYDMDLELRAGYRLLTTDKMDQMFAAVDIVGLPMLKEGYGTQSFDAAERFGRLSGFGEKLVLATEYEALATTDYTEREEIWSASTTHGLLVESVSESSSTFHRRCFPVRMQISKNVRVSSNVR
jgi:hypothetical protein